MFRSKHYHNHCYQIHPGKERQLDNFTLKTQVQHKDDIPSMITTFRTCENEHSLTKSLKKVPHNIRTLIRNSISTGTNIRGTHLQSKTQNTTKDGNNKTTK